MEILKQLKQLGDFQLFEQFYQSQRLCLKTKGLAGQFLKNRHVQVPRIDEDETQRAQRLGSLVVKSAPGDSRLCPRAASVDIRM